jgi:hypothetical protein
LIRGGFWHAALTPLAPTAGSVLARVVTAGYNPGFAGKLLDVGGAHRLRALAMLLEAVRLTMWADLSSPFFLLDRF